MHIVFVCTGNICRSAMAEVIADRVLAERGVDGMAISSAGTATEDGLPATELARQVAREHGLSLDHHRSTQATRQVIDGADLVLTMTSRHLAQVRAIGGSADAQLLSAFATRGRDQQSIADPFGADLDAYRVTFDEVEAMVRRAMDRVLDEQGGDSSGK